MEVMPTKNGITVIPETDFEINYLKILFTLNDKRKVTFNHDTGCLKVTAVEKDKWSILA